MRLFVTREFASASISLIALLCSIRLLEKYVIEFNEAAVTMARSRNIITKTSSPTVGLNFSFYDTIVAATFNYAASVHGYMTKYSNGYLQDEQVSDALARLLKDNVAQVMVFETIPEGRGPLESAYTYSLLRQLGVASIDCKS